MNNTYLKQALGAIRDGIKTLASFGSALLDAGGMIVGVRHSKEPDYQLLSTDGNIQIRLYPAILTAETLIDADYAASGSLGFKRLAGFIFGENHSAQQLAMTVPVSRQAVDKQWLMSFVMPAAQTLETLPKPINPDIAIKEIPARKVAVLSYSGSLTLDSITHNSQLLLNWLDSRQIQAVSEPRSAAYDPPWTLPQLRRNEIHIDIA